MRQRDYANRPIDLLLGDTTLSDLDQEISKVASRHSQIIGVLAIGSMLQTAPPDNFYNPLRSGRLSGAYESIRQPHRRRTFPSNDSDLDIWVCTRDTAVSARSRHTVELGGMALLEELASGTLLRGTTHWRSKKLDVFDRFYKKSYLYSDDTNCGEPWMAHEFKQDLEEMITHKMPSLVRIVNSSMNRSLPGNFLEVRAFPESLFHLRPDESVLPDGSEDRAPFPRVADRQWISPTHNAHVFYARDDVSIYPFAQDGDILGSSIDKHIRHMSELEKRDVSMGGILLKPDALTSGQLDEIRSKIETKISENKGRIVIEEEINSLTCDQIETIYPLISSDDLRDVSDYLQSGKVIIMLVELPCGPYEVFKIINSIKGQRIGDRSIERLYEGRITDGAVRDLLPLPGDEDRYEKLIGTILRRRSNPSVRFSDDDYSYYSRNLMHTPDNSIEFQALADVVTKESQNA